MSKREIVSTEGIAYKAVDKIKEYRECVEDWLRRGWRESEASHWIHITSRYEDIRSSRLRFECRFHELVKILNDDIKKQPGGRRFRKRRPRNLYAIEEKAGLHHLHGLLWHYHSTNQLQHRFDSADWIGKNVIKVNNPLIYVNDHSKSPVSYMTKYLEPDATGRVHIYGQAPKSVYKNKFRPR
jgi:hypothetical protein